MSTPKPVAAKPRPATAVPENSDILNLLKTVRPHSLLIPNQSIASLNQKFDDFQNRVSAKIETLHNDYQSLSQRFEHFTRDEPQPPTGMQFTLGQQEEQAHAQPPLLAENADAMIESIRKNLDDTREVLQANGTYSLRVSRRY